MNGKINCLPGSNVSRAAMSKQSKGVHLQKAIAMSPNKPATVKVGK